MNEQCEDLDGKQEMQENSKHNANKKHHGKEDITNDCTCNETCPKEDCECDKQDCCKERDLNKECSKKDENCNENCKCKNQEIDEQPIPPPEENQPNYLSDLLRVQAEFDNYRKRMITSLSDARQDGFMDAITQFLPALDSFKMASDMITDKNTLMGIKFIEKGILDTLSKMGVEVIDATGKFDPHLHQAIDTDSTADVESGYIVKEAYKGFTYKGKVIRYSQVIVKK